MALTACPECGKTVSDQALGCPHCGFPLKEDPVLDYAERRVRVGYVVPWIMMGVAVFLTVVAFLSKDSRPLTRPLAATFILMSILTLVGNLVRDYQVRKSKIRLGKFPDRRL